MIKVYPPYEYVRQDDLNMVLDDLLVSISAKKEVLQQVRDARHSKSQDIERILLEDFQSLGFVHSATRRKIPDLFGPACDFEIDFFSQQLAMAIEVEKGRNFNVWKDVCKLVESPLVQHAVLVVPYQKSSKGVVETVFHNTLRRLGNVEGMLSKLRSLVVIGY